ncbi:hypothetical protein GF343_01030 [Candidatus Woesearchaeota archaeon]|nr:hypothetical protein [Candidatus Woesearchaeota archaeon]
MEKKELSLIILGIVAVIAVVGLVLLFKTAMSGAAANIPAKFPQARTYSNVQEQPWPYAHGTPEGGVVEKPAYTDGVQTGEISIEQSKKVYGTGEGLVYRDWGRARYPERTAVAQKDVCDALARLGEVPKTHTFGASFTMLKDGIVVDDKCVQSPRWTQPGSTGTPLCCIPPGAQVR